MFFQSIKGNVSQQVAMSIEEDIREEEVEYVLSHLANDKSFLNHLFKILKALLRQSFKKCGVLVTCLIPGRLGLSSL